MSLAEVAAYAAVLFVAVAGAGILTSRTAIERLAGMGLLPRAFVQLVPVLTLAARTLAIVLIVAGLGRVAYTAGWISRQWINRYGLSSFLVIVGMALLGLTLRRKKA